VTQRQNSNLGFIASKANLRLQLLNKHHTAAPREGLIAWKKKNSKKIIGCFPMHIPEEIIHAAGMLPVVMWESAAPITLGHAHISPYNCGIVRSVIDDGARGRLDVLDGFVSYETCLQARHLHFILQQTWKPAYGQRIFLPGVIAGEAARPFMIENLKRLKESIECFGRQEISPASLGQSIRAYNENRSLLRRLYQLRRRHPGLLKAAEVAAVVHASMLMLKPCSCIKSSKIEVKKTCGSPRNMV
jgi:benzoyl-CoA reductase subunit C